MKTRDRLIIWGALVVLVLAGRLYSAWVTPYSYLGGTGNGAIMRTANGSFTSSWETDYRVNRLSGIRRSQAHRFDMPASVLRLAGSIFTGLLFSHFVAASAAVAPSPHADGLRHVQVHSFHDYL